MTPRACRYVWALAPLAILMAGASTAQGGFPVPPKPLKPAVERPTPPAASDAAPAALPRDSAPTEPVTASDVETAAQAVTAVESLDPVPTREALATPASPGSEHGDPTSQPPPSPALRELQAQYDAVEATPATVAGEESRTRPALDGNLVIRAMSGLAFICGLILVLAWAARRFGARTPLLAGASLGQVMGRVHLSTKVSLHYVRSGGRVLVIAVTPAQASLITEFEGTAFDQPAKAIPGGLDPGSAPQKHSFADHLRSRNTERATVASSPGADDELAGLQGDIERLRNHLRESARELEES